MVVNGAQVTIRHGELDGDPTGASVSGELDNRSVGHIRAALLTAIEDCRGDVVLDLSAVSFADSSALAMLALLYQRLMADGRSLLVARASGAVTTVLDLSGLGELLMSTTTNVTLTRPLTPESTLRMSAHDHHGSRRPPGQRPLEFTFGPGADSPALARVVVTRWMGPTAPDLAEALLVVSELVTNVVLHTGSGGILRMGIGPPLLIEVSDSSQREPQQLRSAGSHGGFGLRLIDQVSEDWGSEVVVDGKVVWVRFPSGLAT